MYKLKFNLRVSTILTTETKDVPGVQLDIPQEPKLDVQELYLKQIKTLLLDNK